MTAIALPGRGPRLPLEQRSGALFSWDVEDCVRRYAAGAAGGGALLTARTGQVPVFTRAGATGFHDASGLYRAAIHSVPRIHATYYNGRFEPGLVMEQAETNRCLQSENFGSTWAAVGTPVRIAAAETLGELVFDRLEDDSAAALEGYTQAITFVGNSTKGIAVYWGHGTVDSCVLRLRDTTASANRLLATITETGAAENLPTVAVTTGTLLDIEFVGITAGRRIYRIHFKSTSVTAANTNSLEVYPASTSGLAVADVGDAFLGGVMASDFSACGSYVKTTTVAVTKVADSLHWPIGFLPQQCTVYTKGFVLGVGYGNAAGARHLLALGTDMGFAAGPYLAIFDMSNETGRLQVTFDNGGATSQNGPNLDPAPNDLLECRATITVVGGSGSAILGEAANEGTESVVGAGAAITMPTSWNLNQLTIRGGFAWQRIRVLPGVRTLAECRGAF